MTIAIMDIKVALVLEKLQVVL